MHHRRLLEMIGSFLLGGGVVAAGYELVRVPGEVDLDPASVASAASNDTADRPEGSRRAAGDPAAGARAGDGAAEAQQGGGPVYLQPDEDGHYTAFPPVFADPVPLDEQAEKEFPHHGLITTQAVIIRERPDLESSIAGIVRAGTRLRTDAERTFGGGCGQGWQHIHPDGWICRDAGLSVDDEPPDDPYLAVPDPKVDQPLPYDYWRVKDEMTPFFHRLPSYGEQDRADAAGRRWYETHGRDPMPLDPEERPDDVPAVVKEYMNAGYWVTKAGEEIKSKRRFIRTMRGAYARKYQLHQREPSTYRGLLVPGADALPMYFIRRELSLMEREGEGSDVLVDTGEVPERLSTHPFTRKIYIGNKQYYEDENGNLMRSYAVSKAYKLKRPPGVTADDHWIHIDLSEQTLVAYIGDRPVFVTLVSTGKEEGMTPVGIFRVQTKFVASSMRDQPEEDEAYSIDDVPWTQYFHANVALHGAFWHSGFGLVRSHGCVNLSPGDARWLFGFLRPHVPAGWHGVSASTLEAGDGSPIVVTE